MQGTREGDECTIPEGEIVIYRERLNSAGDVHATLDSIAMDGVSGEGHTTTFKVVDKDISRDDYFNLYATAFAKLGGFGEDEVQDLASFWREDAERQLEAAARFPEGVVLERRNFDVQPRSEYNFRFPYEG